MKSGILISFVLVVLFRVQQAFASSFANASCGAYANGSLIEEGNTMLDLILSESNVGSEDQVKLRKYVKKVTKAAEKERSSEEFMFTYNKYFVLILNLVQKFPIEEAGMISDSLNAFLIPIKEAFAPASKEKAICTDYELFFDLPDNQFDELYSETSDDYFIKIMMEYPEGSMAKHYGNLWTTLNEMDKLDLSHDEMVFLIDSALKHFSTEFVASNLRTFAAELNDEEVFNINFASLSKSFDLAMRKIGDNLAGRF